MRGEGGFTLIELLVTLVIAGLVLAVVIPFGGRHSDRAVLARSVDEIAGSLRLARSRAIRDDRAEAVTIDTGTARYRAAGSGGSGGFPAGTHLVLTTTEDERQNAAVGSIRFFPDGSSTGGGVTIERGLLHYEVLVDWLTGGVSIAPAR